MFKIRHWYKLQLQTPGTMKLFGNTHKNIYKTKNRKNIPSLVKDEVVLVPCDLLDKQYQQKYDV